MRRKWHEAQRTIILFPLYLRNTTTLDKPPPPPARLVGSCNHVPAPCSVCGRGAWPAGSVIGTHDRTLNASSPSASPKPAMSRRCCCLPRRLGAGMSLHRTSRGRVARVPTSLYLKWSRCKFICKPGNYSVCLYVNRVICIL